MGRRKQAAAAVEVEDAETMYDAIADELELSGVAPLMALAMNAHDLPEWQELPRETQTFFVRVIQRFYE